MSLVQDWIVTSVKIQTDVFALVILVLQTHVLVHVTHIMIVLLDVHV